MTRRTVEEYVVKLKEKPAFTPSVRKLPSGAKKEGEGTRNEAQAGASEAPKTTGAAGPEEKTGPRPPTPPPPQKTAPPHCPAAVPPTAFLESQNAPAHLAHASIPATASRPQTSKNRPHAQSLPKSNPVTHLKPDPANAASDDVPALELDHEVPDAPNAPGDTTPEMRGTSPQP